MEGFMVSIITEAGGREILQRKPKRPAWAAGKARMAISQLWVAPHPLVPWYLGLNIKQWNRSKSLFKVGGLEGPHDWYMQRGRSVLWGQQKGMSSLPMASRILILGKWYLSIQQAVSNLKLNSLKPNPIPKQIKLAHAPWTSAHFFG